MPKVVMNAKGQLEFVPIGPDEWFKSVSKILWNGEPHSGKSTALTGLPAPRHILIAPGEQGYGTLVEDDQQKVYPFELGRQSDEYQWEKFKDVAMGIVAGTQGPVTSISLDGLHVLFDLVLRAHGWPNGEGFGEKERGKGWGAVYTDFYNFLDDILDSPIPYKAATCYDGTELIDPLNDKRSLALWPDLPGKSAKRVMGKFPLVIHTKRTGTGQREEFWWELEAKENVRGVGSHLPIQLKKKLPAFLGPNPVWPQLEKLLRDCYEQVPKTLGVTA